MFTQQPPIDSERAPYFLSVERNSWYGRIPRELSSPLVLIDSTSKLHHRATPKLPHCPSFLPASYSDSQKLFSHKPFTAATQSRLHTQSKRRIPSSNPTSRITQYSSRLDPTSGKPAVHWAVFQICLSAASALPLIVAYYRKRAKRWRATQKSTIWSAAVGTTLAAVYEVFVSSGELAEKGLVGRVFLLLLAMFFSPAKAISLKKPHLRVW